MSRVDLKQGLVVSRLPPPDQVRAPDDEDEDDGDGGRDDDLDVIVGEPGVVTLQGHAVCHVELCEGPKARHELRERRRKVEVDGVRDCGDNLGG